MENIRVKKLIVGLTVLGLTLSSCSSLLNYKKSKDEFKIAEFDKQVKIVDPEEPEESTVAVASLDQTAAVSEDKTKAVPAKTKTTKAVVKAAAVKKIAKKVSQAASGDVSPFEAKSLTREPSIEDSEGFNNQRRPVKDPFRVGEKIVHDVSYLGATAGTLVLNVKPFVTVNERNSYNFSITLKTTSFFSKIYAVDDKVTTYVDYETLLPTVFKLDIKDSGQVKEAKSYFNYNTNRASYWEHRYTEKDGHEEKKLNWTMQPYSQNPFSAIFYMRVFNYTVGKEYTFRVADDEKNVMFKAKVLEKTKLKTEAGSFNAIKLKAEVVSRGNLAKASDFYLWISDDDRKYILRIEVKLPFGSIVSEASEIVPGKD